MSPFDRYQRSTTVLIAKDSISSHPMMTTSSKRCSTEVGLRSPVSNPLVEKKDISKRRLKREMDRIIAYTSAPSNQICYMSDQIVNLCECQINSQAVIVSLHITVSGN